MGLALPTKQMQQQGLSHHVRRATYLIYHLRPIHKRTPVQEQIQWGLGLADDADDASLLLKPLIVSFVLPAAIVML